MSPDDRFALVVFGNPAWPGPRQLLDLWLLDTATLEWTQLPGMPVAAALKSHAINWAPDGRVVMVGIFDGVGNAVVTWTPTDDHLQLRTTKLRSASIVAMSAAAGSRQLVVRLRAVRIGGTHCTLQRTATETDPVPQVCSALPGGSLAGTFRQS